MSNLLEVLDFHSNQYTLIKQGETFLLMGPHPLFIGISLVLVSSRFMELFLTDDVYICPMLINAFEDLVRKSR